MIITTTISCKVSILYGTMLNSIKQKQPFLAMIVRRSGRTVLELCGTSMKRRQLFFYRDDHRHLTQCSHRYFATEARDVQDRDKLNNHAEMHLDFFGEPVTFLGRSEADKTQSAMAAHDNFQLTVVSKGKSCIGGSDEEGLELKSQHAAALAWSEALRFAAVWNQEGTKKSAPMLAVAAVAPLLANAGVAYTQHVDSLLKQSKSGAPGLPPIQMIQIADCAVIRQNDSSLNVREREHLKALSCLLNDEHKMALVIYMRILRICPGDVLALSIAMDLARNLGDKYAAMRFVTTVPGC